jgi:hypothetical protein
MSLALRNDRRSTRHAAKLVCQVVREGDFRLIARRTIDVSAEGMRVVLGDVDVKVGEALLVSFQVTPFGLWFDVEGKVARVIAGRRPGDRGRRAMGVKLDLPAVTRLILRGAIRKIPPPVPARAQRIDWARTVKLMA